MSEALQERASFRRVGKTRTGGLRKRFACQSVLKDRSLVFRFRGYVLANRGVLRLLATR